MSTSTVYLITGANRGIGAGITAALLQRPNTTVIATSRKPVSSEPPAPLASGSKFISFLLDEENPAITSATLASRLEKEQGITKLNVVIANAGDSAGFYDVAKTNPDDMMYDFKVNSVGPAKLFAACWPLLDHDSGVVGQQKKFAVVSSAIGSIGMQLMESGTGLAYGMSKAALNYFAVSAAMQFKERGLLVSVLHPGWVQTSMGQAFADATGYAGEVPTDVPSSAKGIIEQIDALTPETSGQFFTFEGKPLPW